MIVYEAGGAAAARAGEAEVGGRRLAGRLLPYAGESLPARFDPIERRFALRKVDAVVVAGPHDPKAWRGAAARLPPGPLAVGPGAPAEEIHGAYRAAAEAALSAGRAVYLLDPEPAGIPEGAAGAAVVLASWRPGRSSAAFPGLAVARAAGLSAAAIFPLLRGWTDGPETVEALLAAAEAGGAASATALLPCADGPARRAIVDARSATEPASLDGFFERVHHGDWSGLSARIPEVRAAAARRGLAAFPPRPVGRRGAEANGTAAAWLEERAELADGDEHRVALLHAAVRWIDESPRDLAAVAREGNFRKVFPFGAEVAAEIEAALLGRT